MGRRLTQGYELNIDNYLKILLIIQRYRSRLPVILMGESGCGKTFLLRYVAEVLFRERVEFFSFILYYGVKESDFVRFVDNMITIAHKARHKDIWIFFDEFNTSELQSIICELLFDRVFSISKDFKGTRAVTADQPLPPNIFFVAACNPFKMRQIDPSNEDDVVNVHPDMKNLLSHRVFPLPPRILGYLWDYGSLSKKSERNYISSMIGKLKLRPRLKESLADSIKKSQDFIKEIVEKRESSVSLRDIKRVVKIFHFFACYLQFRLHPQNYLKAAALEQKQTLSGSQREQPSNRRARQNYFKNRYKDFDEFYKSADFNHSKLSVEAFQKVFTITLIVNYIFRISNEGRRSD